MKYFLLANVTLKLIFEQTQPIPITVLHFETAFDLFLFLISNPLFRFVLTKVLFLGPQDLTSSLEKGSAVRIRRFEIRGGN